MRKAILTVIVVLSVLTAAYTQPKFWNEIKVFKQQDSVSRPPKHAILFVGSSSIRRWNINDSFKGYPIINRGFGGSTFPDIIHYAEEIIFPYQPKQIVIYCGDNDLASSDDVTPQFVFNNLKKLLGMIRSKLPTVNIVCVAIKPSPNRQKLMPKIKETNDLIENYLRKDKNACYADVYSKMLDKNGEPISDLFKEDNLHMNEKGYAIWEKVIGPRLMK